MSWYFKLKGWIMEGIWGEISNICISKACNSLNGCTLDPPKKTLHVLTVLFRGVFLFLKKKKQLEKLHKYTALTIILTAAEIALIVVAELCSIMHKKTVNPWQTNQSLQWGNDQGCISINWWNQTNNVYGGKTGESEKTLVVNSFENYISIRIIILQAVMNKT